MTIICIEDGDEALLDETLTNLLRRNKKKGKNVIRTDKLNKNILITMTFLHFFQLCII
jgi:hypothetical protein